jgi:hypothetical protein
MLRMGAPAPLVRHTVTRMLGLLDDDEPPPVIGLCGVLALIAATATAIAEARFVFETSALDSVSYGWSMVSAPLVLGPPLAGTALLCAAAVCFQQARWALISGAIVLAGVAIPSVVLLFVRL